MDRVVGFERDESDDCGERLELRPRVEDYAWLRDGRMLYSENTLARIAGSRHPEIGLDNRSGVTIGESKTNQALRGVQYCWSERHCGRLAS
jgi:hypothetical protein